MLPAAQRHVRHSALWDEYRTGLTWKQNPHALMLGQYCFPFDAYDAGQPICVLCFLHVFSLCFESSGCHKSCLTCCFIFPLYEHAHRLL
jgi:hypothetical protein